MPKGEKHFANTVPCNTELSSQSHCSHFQTRTSHFLHCLSQTDCRCMHLYRVYNFFFPLEFLTFIYMYFFFQFFCTTLHYLHHRHMYELYREWVMQHISQTILKENQEVVNLILPKTSSNYCTFRNFAFCTLGLHCILLILYLGVNDPPA